ncbi:hypothetical protein GCM10025865_29310 [Paraoerskovia sediminicola]|uniref:Uncharacterized protein n=1 Tax=Paraoerskovia sediminicola TaxID=1138587 RepID=A0ABM8G6D9_9CELL|nr:hypothetical protein GCM10025865_29310 [Paraoerskovia sediminicola]
MLLTLGLTFVTGLMVWLGVRLGRAFALAAAISVFVVTVLVVLIFPFPGQPEGEPFRVLVAGQYASRYYIAPVFAAAMFAFALRPERRSS